MKLENTLNKIKENSLNESISIDNVDIFLGELIKEGNIKSSVKEICYTVPMSGPSGFVYGSVKEGDVIKIKRSKVDANDHITVTEITKEVIDDVYSQFGEDAPKLLADLIKRDIAIEQDKELFTFINDIATKKTDMELSASDFEAQLVALQGYMDEIGMKVAADVKATTSTVIIGSPKVIGLLVKDDIELTRKQEKMYSYAGSLGSRDLFVDFEATEDYITVGVNGDDTLRGVTFCPYNIATNFTEKYSDGAKVVRLNNRYAFQQNPIDTLGSGKSKFFVKTKILFI